MSKRRLHLALYVGAVATLGVGAWQPAPSALVGWAPVICLIGLVVTLVGSRLLRHFLGFGALLALSLVVQNVKLNSYHLRQDVACRDNLQHLSGALQLYAADNAGHFPASLAALATLPSEHRITELPTCPIAGSQYRYQHLGDPERYTLVCHAGHRSGDVVVSSSP